MTNASRIEGYLVRDPVGWDSLAKVLGDVMAVDPADVQVFDVDSLIEPPPPVLVEIRKRESGFRLDLTLYLRPPAVKMADTQLARRLAVTLGQEVLTSPPPEEDGSAPPDRWILARPDGSLFLVRQVDPESDDIEIDPDPHRMTRLAGPEAPR